MSDSDCERAGCKGWSMYPSTALDVVEVRLCPPCKREFQVDQAATVLNAEQMEMAGTERRLLAVISSGAAVDGHQLHEDHVAIVDEIIKHQRKRREFVLRWLATPKPVPLVETATEPKEIP